MYSLSESLYVYEYGQSGYSHYSNVIAGGPRYTNWATWEMHLEAIVMRQSVSHHHHQFGGERPTWGICQYRNNGGGLSNEACRDTEITEMDRAMGSIHLGDTGVLRHHLIKWNTQSIFPSSQSQTLLPNLHRLMHFVLFHMHCGWAFIDPHN